MKEKSDLREKLRRTRANYVAALPGDARALMFHRPPRILSDQIPADALIGLYYNSAHEAPTGGYARFFAEQGHRLALPYFAERGAPMQFREWHDPFAESDLVKGPYGVMQPAPAEETEGDSAEAALIPDILFVPLVGFTEQGERIGQGGGHYDRWLADNPDARAYGLAWDCQRVDALPSEAHDRALSAIITPSCLYEPSNKDRPS